MTPTVYIKVQTLISDVRLHKVVHGNSKPAVAMSTSDNIAADSSSPERTKKKQLLLSDGIRLYIANTLTTFLESDDIGEEDGLIIKILDKKGSRGRPKAAARLIEFMEKSDNPLLVDRTTSGETLTKWIDECVQIGRQECERQASDAEKGRNSADSDIPQHVIAWSYLMKQFDSEKEKAVKTTRYNRVPDHLQGTGVALIKCNLVFVPGSVGVGAGRDDLIKAQNHIMATRASALAQSEDEAEAGHGGSGAAKTRVHLEPNRAKRLKHEDFENGRQKLYHCMDKLVTIQHDRAVADKHTSQIALLNQQIAQYTTHLSNPALSVTVKQNFTNLLLQAQTQLQTVQQRMFEDGPASSPRFSASEPSVSGSSTLSSPGA